MAVARIERTNFSAGELSPWRRAASKHGSYENGVALARNMVVNGETNLTRRPGTRFLRALKTEGAIGRLLAFRYSGSDSYTLVLNGGAIRFVRAGGFVLDAGNPYEVAIPYAAADLPNVRIAQEGNTAWLVCAGFEPRTLVRGASHTAWTLALYRPAGGPVKIQNLDTAKTIRASAVSGTGITLTGVGTAFAAGHVGSVWKLAESDLSITPNWKASETISIPTAALPSGTDFGDFSNLANAWDGNPGTVADVNPGGSGFIGRTYAPAETVASVRVRGVVAVGAFSGVLELWGKIGGVAPVSVADARTGTLLSATSVSGTFDKTLASSALATAFDHLTIVLATNAPQIEISEINPVAFASGAGGAVLRRFNGNVYQAIAGSDTGVAPPVHSEGDVLSEEGGVLWRFRHGPYGLVRITAVGGATSATADVLTTLPDSVVTRPGYRWSEGAWNAIDGWPERVLLIDRGLFFGRGRDWWMTKVGDPADLEVTSVPEESALAESLRSRDGSLSTIEWALDNGVIVLGLRDGEVMLRAGGSPLDPITATNVRAPPASGEGSASHIPVAVEGGVVWIGRTRKRLHYARFDTDTQKLEPVHVSKNGRHLLAGGAAALAWQRDPHKIVWTACQNGDLVGLTMNVEEKILAMHGHPMVNGIVEDVCAMPSSDEGTSDLTLIVRRTIDGATRRYVEQLGTYFEAASGQTDAAGAWYFDCALAYAGGSVTSITGLDHLEGEEVGIIADNAGHARKTVTAGAVALDRPCTSALVGLPIDARVTDLPRNVASEGGTTKGRHKRATHCVIDLVESIGGVISVNGGRSEALALTGTQVTAAPQLFTGSRRKQMTGPIGDEAAITIAASDGFPLTIAAMTPDLDVIED